MNSKERVRRTLEHSEPDRVPIGEWGIDHDVVEKAIGHSTYWRAKADTTKALWAGRRDEVVESFKEDLVQFTEELDQDLVPVHFVPPDDYEPPEVERVDDTTWREESGRIWKYSEGNDALLPLNEPSPDFQSVEELTDHFESHVVPRCGFKIVSKNNGHYDLEIDDESRLELIKFVVDQLGDEKFIYARGFEEAIGSPEPLFFSEFESLSLFFGINMEDYFKPIVTKPELTRKAFDLYTELTIAMAEEYIRAGVDAIAPQGDFSDGTGPMVSPESIKRIFYPGMKRLSDFAHEHGVKVLTHNCGNNWKIMDLLIDVGYDCWQSIQIKTADMDLRKLKERYGDEIALWGGIALETLLEGTREEVEREVLDSIKTAAPGGGFILGTSNSVAFGTKYENYLAALETLDKHGNYPIGS